MTEYRVSVEELAHRLCVNQRTVRRWIKQGVISAASLARRGHGDLVGPLGLSDD
ncbi:helix-turn-helix DNA binding domain protein [Mycobacterium phage MadKillah]|nr:helix-turn-helix DNA binding domain protein [Mycobacterium phage MadKillah]